MVITVSPRRRPINSIDSTLRAWTGFSNRCGSMMGRKAHLSLDEVSERLANQNSGSNSGRDCIGYMVQVWLRRSALPTRIGKIVDQSQCGIDKTTDVLAVPGPAQLAGRIRVDPRTFSVLFVFAIFCLKSNEY